MAKYKDIDNIPSNLRSQGNNALFDIGNDYVGVWAIKFTTTQEYADKLQGFWKMFGYKVNEVKVPNLYTRQSWNYVKTVDTVSYTHLDVYKRQVSNQCTINSPSNFKLWK